MESINFNRTRIRRTLTCKTRVDFLFPPPLNIKKKRTTYLIFKSCLHSIFVEFFKKIRLIKADLISHFDISMFKYVEFFFLTAYIQAENLSLLRN